MRSIFAVVACLALLSIQVEAGRLAALGGRSKVQSDVGGSAGGSGSGSGSGEANGDANGGAASASGSYGDASATIHVDDCYYAPFYDQPFIIISTGTDCTSGTVTFSFFGTVPATGGDGPCQGPTDWVSNSMVLNETSNETLSAIVKTPIWVIPHIGTINTPRKLAAPIPQCKVMATFSFFTDSACTQAFNLVTGGSSYTSLTSLEDWSTCTDAHKVNPLFRPEMGSYKISGSMHVAASALVALAAIIASKLLAPAP